VTPPEDNHYPLKWRLPSPSHLVPRKSKQVPQHETPTPISLITLINNEVNYGDGLMIYDTISRLMTIIVGQQ